MSENYEPKPRSPLSSITNRLKVVSNFAISGHRDSPFENVEAKKPFSRRAKKIALAAGVLAAGAAVAVTSVLAAKGVSSYEKSNRARNEAIQEAMANQLNPLMVGIDEKALTAWRSGKSDLQESFPAPGEVAFTDDTAQITMGTESTTGPGSHTPVPSNPLEATWENNSGTGAGTIGTQFTIVSRNGNTAFNKGGGFIDFYGSTGGGWGAVDSNADTTNIGGLSGSPSTQAAVQAVVSDANNFPPQYNT
jgi:hypothetical protein